MKDKKLFDAEITAVWVVVMDHYLNACQSINGFELFLTRSDAREWVRKNLGKQYHDSYPKVKIVKFVRDW